MHVAGVMHADLKPDNIILHIDESGELLRRSLQPLPMSTARRMLTGM